MPCCEDGNVVNCANGSCEQEVTIVKFVPELSVTVSCSNSTQSNRSTTKDCVTGCGGCGCEEAGLCRCVPLGAAITLTPTVVLNNSSCIDPITGEEPGTLVTTIGEDTVDTQVLGTPTPVYIAFDTEGEYEIVMTATNCCASCVFTWTVFVGPPIVLERISCGAFQFKDYSLYVTPTRIKVTLRSIDNKLISTWYVEEYVPGTTTLPVMAIPDGIYVVSFEEIDGVGVVLNTRKFVTYEFCTLYECYQNILRNFLCDTCDCNNVTDKAAFRDLANRFVSAAGAFFMSVDVQYGNSYGMLTYKEADLGMLRNQDILYKGIMKLCGSCLEATTSGTICSTC